MLLNPVQAATTNIVTDIVMKVIDNEQITKDVDPALEHTNNGVYPNKKNTLAKRVKRQSKNVVVIVLILVIFESSLYLFSNTNTRSYGNESLGMISIILRNDNKCSDLFNLNNITGKNFNLRGTRSTQWITDYNDTQQCNFVLSYLYQI